MTAERRTIESALAGSPMTGPGGPGHKVRISGFESWKFSTDGLIENSIGHFDAAEYARQLTHGFGK